MAESSKGSFPTNLTPYALGVGVMVLVVIFSLMSSAPWASKSEIEHVRSYVRGEVEWIKDQQKRIQQHLEIIEVGRNTRAEQINEIRAKATDCERRIQRLEDGRLRPP